MGESYVLEWLDSLISVTLNPAKTEIGSILPEDSVKLTTQVIREKDKVLAAIKSAVFNLTDESTIRCAVDKYHSSLIALLDQALENKANIPEGNLLRQVLDTIIVSIDEMLFLIERRFRKYLGSDERVPATYLKILKKKISNRLAAVSKKMRTYQEFQSPLNIVASELNIFLSLSPNTHSHSFREIFYVEDLCLGLEHIKQVNKVAFYSSLDELLITMNFNSKNYINNLTQRLADSINSVVDQASEKMESLLFYLKIFNQFHKRPGMIFNSKDADLHTQVINWFAQEIFYLERLIPNSFHPLKTKSPGKEAKVEEKQKILAMLSVDQMALILRAADEMKIIMARSLNSVFKSIVPHLATPYQENISYDSMRSKSYSAEVKDKEIVIQNLQEMIKKIRDY